MAQSLSDIILHIVFSTKDREPLIHHHLEEELYKYICGVCRNLECPVIKINGVEDHIHILLHLDKSMATSKLISEIKSNSSRWVKTKGNQYKKFAWQAGYGAFSVSRPNLHQVVKYIDAQKKHHKKISFKEEFIAMLQRAQIPYDEKNLWL